jgi:hypothetical protein
METQEQNSGVDFFDFLYEIWRAKWIVLPIIVFFAAAGAIWAMKSSQVSENETVPQLHAQIPFSLVWGNDPLTRGGSTLLADFISRVDREGKLGLVFAGVASASKSDNEVVNLIRSQNSRTFDVNYMDDLRYGFINVTIKDGDRSVYEQVYNALRVAAKEQADDTAEIARGALDMFTNASSRFPSVQQLTIDGSIVSAMLFLATPEVRNGSFRFFTFGNLALKEDVLADDVLAESAAGGSGLKKMLVALMAGSALSLLVVMFRIALQRKRAL